MICDDQRLIFLPLRGACHSGHRLFISAFALVSKIICDDQRLVFLLLRGACHLGHWLFISTFILVSKTICDNWKLIFLLSRSARCSGHRLFISAFMLVSKIICVWWHNLISHGVSPEFERGMFTLWDMCSNLKWQLKYSMSTPWGYAIFKLTSSKALIPPRPLEWHQFILAVKQ